MIQQGGVCSLVMLGSGQNITAANQRSKNSDALQEETQYKLMH